MVLGKKGGLLLFFFILVVVLLPSVLSLGLNGQKLGTVIFEPGKVITNHYTITGTNLESNLGVGSEVFSDYMRVEKTSSNEYDLIIEFPLKLDIEPGIYPVSISASEVAPEGSSGINSLVSVGKTFRVEVYSYDKEITASFNAQSVNENLPVEFSIGVNSKTYSDVDSIKADVVVYDWLDHEIAKLQTNTISLPTLTSDTLSATLETTGLDPGNYWAEALVTYDGKIKLLNDTFKIGDMDVTLKNHSEELNLGFSNFEIIVENSWGNRIKDVYSKLFIDSKEYLHTPSIDLEPWAEGTLQGIVEVDLEPGVYPAELNLYFSGEEKSEDIFLKIIDKPTPQELIAEMELEKKNKTITSLVIAIIMFMVVLFIVFFVKRWKEKQDEF